MVGVELSTGEACWEVLEDVALRGHLEVPPSIDPPRNPAQLHPCRWPPTNWLHARVWCSGAACQTRLRLLRRVEAPPPALPTTHSTLTDQPMTITSEFHLNG